jgi:hypothetical protein
MGQMKFTGSCLLQEKIPSFPSSKWAAFSYCCLWQGAELCPLLSVLSPASILSSRNYVVELGCQVDPAELLKARALLTNHPICAYEPFLSLQSNNVHFLSKNTDQLQEVFPD